LIPVVQKQIIFGLTIMSKSLSLKFIFSPKFDFFQVDPDFFFILSELYEIKLRININCCDASGVCNRVPSVRDVP